MRNNRQTAFTTGVMGGLVLGIMLTYNFMNPKTSTTAQIDSGCKEKTLKAMRTAQGLPSDFSDLPPGSYIVEYVFDPSVGLVLVKWDASSDGFGMTGRRLVEHVPAMYQEPGRTLAIDLHNRNF